MRNSRTIIRSCAVLACASLCRLAMADGPSQPSVSAPGDAKFIYANTASAAAVLAHAPGNQCLVATSDGAKDPSFPIQSVEKSIYADVGSAPNSSTAPAAAQESAPGDHAPLMGLLMMTPLGHTLEDAHINVFGWIEGSYEYNFSVRDHSPNQGRAFDLFENNKGDINQVDLTVERKVDMASKQFDFGGRVDILYGGDARYTTSSDFFSSQGPVGATVSPNPGFARQEAWFDLPQLYVDILVPVGQGVRVRLGKFEFFKNLDPNASPFYTHPIEYNSAFPFTLTGISLMTPITSQVSIEGGISRGWNQTLTDNNGTIDGFGRVRWDINEASRIILSAITGPEQFHDNVHFTTALDLTFACAVTKAFLLVVDGTYGHTSDAQFLNEPGANTPPGNYGVGGTGANWYGINAEGTYTICDYANVSGRLEWYRDEEGAGLSLRQIVPAGGVVIGTNNSFSAIREGANLYEATIGLNVMPLHATPIRDYFILRPELRYDYASKDYFHNGARHDQLTIAIDAIFNF